MYSALFCCPRTPCHWVGQEAVRISWSFGNKCHSALLTQIISTAVDLSFSPPTCTQTKTTDQMHKYLGKMHALCPHLFCQTWRVLVKKLSALMSEENVLQHGDSWMQEELQSAAQGWQESEPVPWQQASVPVKSWGVTIFTAWVIAAHSCHRRWGRVAVCITKTCSLYRSALGWTLALKVAKPDSLTKYSNYV